MKRRDFMKAGAVAGGGAAVAAASSFPAPAVAQERVDIAIVSSWPRDFPGLGTGAQRFAQSVADASDGKFQITYFAAGERVGAFDVFDEVASGNSQGYHAADYYATGKHPGFAYYSAVPFGMTPAEINAWLYFGGGQELWDELSGEFGLKAMACGNSGGQWGGWFNKEINAASDLQGLKMRIPGLGGNLLSKLGASPVSLPGGQIYENLVSGAIDATEWVGPWNDEAMKFYEAARYYYYPGVHEPGTVLSFGINASLWGRFSRSDRALFEACARAENNTMLAEFNAKNGAALTRLIEDQGVELREFSDAIYDAFATAADEVFEETRQHSPLANRIHESFLASRNEVSRYIELNDVNYIQKRNARIRR
ncbi:MAG: TRAP transporter substrate-binding protein [Alphaproteobacteria bacterium]|nr:TRAP transporter substrate-binding protein [Alphaproteobacteria bacterium]MDA7983820.1 TRAP transporter substrate-binding protein [Alphaproteobacteria bacterium]MDA7985148.1 TRAP transporter substrate-binding protein [Alphaproteobacteria bacterium]MDA7989422.1 TRAP transporter substrate-binding protein [Alphaproteobacteria bacterium]MDA8002149.1 TRAP transporter substrate-binding protein [Alphaproteobacteria bacterium]